MLLKVVISSVLALLVFYILVSSCSRMVYIHDRGESTMNEIEVIINGVKESGGRRMALQLPDRKAFYFFENSSNIIEMYDKNKRYYINPNPYCEPNKPCFCYCDDFIRQTYQDDCTLELNCKKHKVVCKSFDLNFSFQKLGNKFFEDDSNSKEIFFQGGFLLAPSFQDINFAVKRTHFYFQNPIGSNVIHLCAKSGECDLGNYSSQENSFLLQHSCHR